MTVWALCLIYLLYEMNSKEAIIANTMLIISLTFSTASSSVSSSTSSSKIPFLKKMPSLVVLCICFTEFWMTWLFFKCSFVNNIERKNFKRKLEILLQNFLCFTETVKETFFQLCNLQYPLPLFLVTFNLTSSKQTIMNESSNINVIKGTVKW